MAAPLVLCRLCTHLSGVRSSQITQPWRPTVAPGRNERRAIAAVVRTAATRRTHCIPRLKIVNRFRTFCVRLDWFVHILNFFPCGVAGCAMLRKASDYEKKGWCTQFCCAGSGYAPSVLARVRALPPLSPLSDSGRQRRSGSSTY